MADEDPRKPPTVSQLRVEIDKGHMGDKVAASDPSSVPLGTDDEAAGTPPSAEALESAMARRETAPQPSRPSAIRPVVWLLVLVAAVVAVVLLAG